MAVLAHTLGNFERSTDADSACSTAALNERSWAAYRHHAIKFHRHSSLCGYGIGMLCGLCDTYMSGTDPQVGTHFGMQPHASCMVLHACLHLFLL